MKEEHKNPNAVALGKLGGKKLAEERGPEYYAKIQAMRKKRKGGRPKNPPNASYEGKFSLGDSEINAVVLEDGRRVLVQATFLRAIGRSQSPKAGTGVLSTVDELPFFLQAEQLKPFITNDLTESTAPVFFTTKSGKQSAGYDAELLPMVAEVYLAFRDDRAASGKKVPKQYEHIVQACDAVMRGLARVGIVALVDEATGFQEVRDRQALQAILDKFLQQEFAAWAKRFPDEFYRQMFRLREWDWKGMKVNRPQVVGKYTRDLVYERLAPGILEELESRNPPNRRGRRKVKHHQWLTEDLGHPALAQHLHALIGFMKASDNWDQFYRMVERAFPKKGDTLFLPLSGEDG